MSTSMFSVPPLPGMRLGLRGKLLVASGLIALLVVAVGLDGQRRVAEAQRRFDILLADDLAPIVSSGLLRHALSRARISLLTLALAASEERSIDPSVAELRAADRAIAESLTACGKLLPEDAAAIGPSLEAVRAFQDIYQPSLARQDSTQLARMAGLSAGPYGRANDLLSSVKDRWRQSAAELHEKGLATYESDRQKMLLVLLAAVVAALSMGQLLSRRVLGRLSRNVSVLERLAAGDFTERLPLQGNDELGDMGRAANLALNRVALAMFEVAQKAERLLGSSQKLSAVSARLGINADGTSTQASAAAAGAEQVSRNVQTVAAGTTQMNASIRDIADNSGAAARVATAAVSKAQATNATVTKLGESSAEIGNVVKVITSIAEQTNLLALNATIEAARAGEAGRGFAVVANEVKELAKETAKAMEDIGRKIAAIQADTRSAVAAIGEITVTVEQVNELQTTIASAVEEQAATTCEIGRNVDEAAKATGSIAGHIAGVAEAARGTQQGAGDTSSAAHEVASLAEELKVVLAGFRFSDHPRAEAVAQGAQSSARHAPLRTGPTPAAI